MSRPTEIKLTPGVSGFVLRDGELVLERDDGAPPQISPREVSLESLPIIILDEEAQSEPPPAPIQKPSSTEDRAARAGFDFVIAYDGTLVGHFHSPRRLLGRTAYRQVAEQLCEVMGEGFDPSRLELYKPVPIDRPELEGLGDGGAGSFHWFDGVPG